MGRPVSQQRWAGAGGVPGVGADDVTAMLEGGGVVWDGPDDTALCNKYILCLFLCQKQKHSEECAN